MRDKVAAAHCGCGNQLQTGKLSLKRGARGGHLKTHYLAFRDGVLQKPGRTNLVDEAVNRREDLRPSLRDDDCLGHAEQIVGKHAVSKHFLQQVGQALTVGAESIDLARRQPTFGVSRRVVGFDQSRLFQIAREIERDRNHFCRRQCAVPAHRCRQRCGWASCPER